MNMHSAVGTRAEGNNLCYVGGGASSRSTLAQKTDVTARNHDHQWPESNERDFVPYLERALDICHADD